MLVSTVLLAFAGNLILSRRLWGDAFYDLYAGRYVAQHGIPRHNVVTVASHGAPWIDQQWLAHLSFYGAWVVGGYPALTVFSCALIAAAFGVLAFIMLRLGVPPVQACGWTLGAMSVCLGNTEVRAQSFGYLFLALTLWLIIEDSRRSRMRWQCWLVIPVLVLWANSYGSVLLGAGLVVLYAGYRVVSALRREDRRARHDAQALAAYLSLGALAAVSVLCCPYGTGIVAYYQRFNRSVVARYDQQWAPPSLHSLPSLNFFVLAAATMIVVAVGWRRGIRPDPLLGGLAVVLLAAALTSYKNVAWFALAGSLLAADTLTRSGIAGRKAERRPRLLRSAVAASAAAAVASVTVAAMTPSSGFEVQIPSRALNIAASVANAHPGWDVLGDDWSSTAMLWLQPSMLGRVGLDLRLEQYTAPELSSWFHFMYAAGPHWQRGTAGYNVIVCSRVRYPALAAAAPGMAGWRVVYDDTDSVVLIRTGRS